MDCSRCNAEAVVKRGSAAYCAKCALARDWEDVIAMVQEEQIDMESVEMVELQDNKKVKKSAPAPQADAEPAPDGDAADDKQPASVAADANGSGPSDELPADPFA